MEELEINSCSVFFPRGGVKFVTQGKGRRRKCVKDLTLQPEIRRTVLKEMREEDDTAPKSLPLCVVAIHTYTDDDDSSFIPLRVEQISHRSG